MVKAEESSFAEPTVDYNRAHENVSPSPAPAGSYRRTSMNGNFVPLNRAAQHKSGWTKQGTGGSHSVGGNHDIGDSYGGMGSPRRKVGSGPGPQHFGSNSPNLNTFADSGHSGGHSSDSTQDMQKQMKVKDKVITELASIVESLEINYEISIADQTHTFQDFMNIAHSMEQEAREVKKAASSSTIKGKCPRHFTSTED